MSTTTPVHKTFFGRIFAWIAKAFITVKDDGVKVAVAVTEAIKNFSNDPLATAIFDGVDHVFHTTIGATVLDAIKKNIGKVLAVELAIEGIPDNPTPADIQAFGKAVATAVSGLNSASTSQLWSTIAAQVLGDIEQLVQNNPRPTFAQLVSMVETAWGQYQADVAAPAPATSTPGA